MGINVTGLARSKEEALEKNERLFYDDGNPCKEGHVPVKKINSLTPLKWKCYECLLEQGRRKKARLRANPEKRGVINSKIRAINNARYTSDPEFKAAIAARAKLNRDKQKCLNYGMSLEDRDYILRKQGGACAICHASDVELTIDHDHSNNVVRGILCHKCNTAVGLLGDSYETILSAAKYVQSLSMREMDAASMVERYEEGGSLPRSSWENMTESEEGELKSLLFDSIRSSGFPYPEEDGNALVSAMASLRQYLGKVSIISESGNVNQVMHGMGELWGYFPHAYGVKCNGRPSPMDMYEDDRLLAKAINHRLSHGTYLSKPGMRKSLCFASPAQSVSNFRPSAAAAIYKRYGGGVVYDPCSGWGGRLAGAVASGVVSRYIGVDASGKTVEGLRKVGDALGAEFEITHGAVEDQMGWEGECDMVFTSPPYFNCEDYSQDEFQSHVRYPTKDSWTDEFLPKFIKRSYELLKPGGHLVLNIADVQSNKTLVNDFMAEISKINGLEFVENLRLALSNRGKAGFKYEPVLVYYKRT